MLWLCGESRCVVERVRQLVLQWALAYVCVGLELCGFRIDEQAKYSMQTECLRCRDVQRMGVSVTCTPAFAGMTDSLIVLQGVDKLSCGPY